MKRLIGSLKLWQKFLVVGLLVALPCAISTGMYLREIGMQVDAASRELDGVAPVQAAVDLLDAVQQRRKAVALQGAGMAGQEAERKSRDAALAQQIAALDPSVAAAGDKVLAEHWSDFKDEAASLQKQLDSGSIAASDAFVRDSELAEGALDAIERLGDAYGLTLDPEAGSYFLVTATLLYVPREIESFAQLRGRGGVLLGAHKVRESDRVLLQSFAREAVTLRGQAGSQYDKSLSSDAQLKAALGPKFEAGAAAGDKALKLLRTSLLDAEKLTFPPEEYGREFSSAIASHYDLVHDSLASLRNLLSARVAALERARLLMAGLVAGVLAIGGVLAIVVVRSVVRPIDAAVRAAEAVGQGDLAHPIVVETTDEAGRLLRALGAMQQGLRERNEADTRVLAETTRIKQALDAASIPVRISDNDGVIVYVNEALRRIFARDEAAFRADIPDFAADRVVGRSIGMFYKDPQPAIERLRGLDRTVTTTLVLGGRTYDVTTSPVRGADGERLGTVGQWVDRTDQLAAEGELAQLVAAASRGQLDGRIRLEGKSGFFLQVGEGINELVGTAQRGLDDIGRVVGALSRGDLTERIDGDYEGTWKRLKDDCNVTVETLGRTIAEVRGAADAL
ncbi:MAG TPA: HAMP domain-containing protein, partial [Burkholderiaceae bacterium]|nr:HAMP domain-containing protein [Burkholderiaceae bacterium]